MGNHIMTAEEMTEYQRCSWLLVEPGFIVDRNQVYREPQERFLVKEKNEHDGTLMVIPLSQENIFMLLAGTVPQAIVIGKNDLLNVYPTAVTDAMCRERNGMHSYCSQCKSVVYEWPEVGTRNYHVGVDGLCRHIDCSAHHKSEPLP